MACDRAQALADDLARANEEALAFAPACTDEQWAVTVPGEGWTVGVVLHHIAEGHAHTLGWLGDTTSGRGVSDNAEGIDRENAEHAWRAQSADQTETAALLEVNGSRLEAALRGLSDIELDRSSAFGPAGGRPLPTEQLAAVTARHAREHLAHARGAVAGAS
ncbi:MAG TPA: DinB family protein [Acidimicrobiales bacterium]|nr:DinB family protein [Acidimicrobiales bacterium]